MSKLDDIQVEQYTIADWNDSITGILLLENDEWCLIEDIPFDYMVDGYKLIKKEFILSRTTGSKEKTIEKVLRLKGHCPSIPENFSFKNTIETLKDLQSLYGLFEFQDDHDDETFYGNIKMLSDESIVIHSITPDGEIDKSFDYVFNHTKIRVITFLSDYFMCMQLLMKNQ